MSAATIEVGVDRTCVRRGSHQRLYVEVAAHTGDSVAQRARALAMILVLDRSELAAPEQSERQAMRRTLAELLRLLRPDDFVGVVVFDEVPRLLQSPVPVADVRETLIAELIELEAGTGSNVGGALELGLDLLAALPRMMHRIVVLASHGRVHSGLSGAARLAAQVGRDRGDAEVIALTHSREANLELLEAIAVAGGQDGIDDLSDPSTARANREALVRRVAGPAVAARLVLRPVEGVQLGFAAEERTRNPLQRREDGSFALSLPPTSSGRPHQVLAALDIHSAVLGPQVELLELLEVKLEWYSPPGGELAIVRKAPCVYVVGREASGTPLERDVQLLARGLLCESECVAARAYDVTASQVGRESSRMRSLRKAMSQLLEELGDDDSELTERLRVRLAMIERLAKMLGAYRP